MTTTLTSNGSPIPYTPQYFGALRDGNLEIGAEELRRRFAEDGYVLLRDAVPAEDVWNLRTAYLDRFGSQMCQDSDTRRGVFAGPVPAGLPAHGMPGHPAHDFVRTQAFRDFTNHTAFRSIAQALLEGPVEQIRRTPLRHFMPGRKAASRAHLDKTYIDGVAADVATIWVPIGDCPVEAGSLLYLDGSHQDRELETKIRDDRAPMDRGDMRPLTHDLKWLTDSTGRRWLTADFKAGDIVVHSPSIIHASTDSQVDLMRISTDIRFRRTGSPSDPRWDNDWSADDGF